MSTGKKGKKRVNVAYESDELPPSTGIGETEKSSYKAGHLNTQL